MLLALLATFLPHVPCSAAIKVWDGSSSGFWSAGANWSDGTRPQNGDELHFPPGVTRRTVTNDISNLQVTFIWFTDFGATNYVLRGNTLTVGGASSGAGGIQSNQTNGVNTVECDITMKSSSVPNVFFIFPGSGTLTLSGDMALAQDPLTIRSDPGSLLRLSGVISGTNGITLSGAGTVRLDGSSANTYTGPTSVQHGVLQLNKSASGTARVSIPGNLILSGSGIARLLFDDQIAHNVNVEVLTALDLNGNDVTVGSLTMDGGVVTNGGVLHLLGDVTTFTSSQILTDVALDLVPGPVNFVITNPPVSLQINGGILGLGGLTKTGAGTLTFLGSHDNNYMGQTTVRGGVLQLAKDFPALAIRGSSLVIGDATDGNATDTVRLMNQAQIGTDVVINRTGLLDLNGFFEVLTDLTLTGGRIQTGAGTRVPQLLGDVTAAAGVQGLTFFTAQISGNLELFSGPHTFTINHSGFFFGVPVDLVVDAILSGSGSITKTGAGALELDGANTYSSTTTIDDGELVVGNNSALGSPSVGTTVNDPGCILMPGGISISSEPLTLNSTASNPGVLFGAGTSNFWGANVFLNQTSHIGVDTNSVLNLGGAIIGPAGLVKEDDGELIFSGSSSNSYGGTTTVNGGTLFLNKLGVDFAVPGDLIVGDGIGGTNADVVFYSFDQIDDSSHVTINSSGAMFVGSDTIGSVSGSGNLEILNTGSLFTGGNNASTILSGVLSGGGTLTKRGTGTFTLNANNTYTGDTTVQAGTLVVNGSQAGSDITVLSGATLGGSGRVGALNVATGGNVAPGTGPGRLTTSSTVLSNDAVLHIELNGATAGTSYDQLKVFGTTTLTGSKLAPSLGFAPFEGQVFTILDNNGTDPVTGTFDSLPNGGLTTINGVQMRINYNGLTGNDVTLTVTNLPARPSTATVITGNGDGHIDPNECNQLFLRVTNATGVALTSVQGVLSSTTPGVVITRATSAYPNMTTLGSAGTNLTAFQFFTGTNFLCGQSIEFLLTLSAAGQPSFVARYILQSGTLTASQSFTNNSGVGIPPSGTVASPIVVSGITGGVAKVTVSMSLFHQNLGELDVFLIPPAGPAIPLVVGLPGTQLGTNCTNGRVTFDDDAAQPIEAGASPYVGTFRPDAPLSLADGDSGPTLNGVWLLEIIDFVPNSSVGALSCWSLAITPATCTDGGGICSVCNGPFFGSITASDPSMPNTIPSSGAPSVCGVSKACPGDLPVTSHFDAFTFTNAGGPACVTVTLDSPCLSISNNPIGCAAFLTFDSAKPCSTYLGDIGDFLATPASFSFTVPSNAVFTVVVDGATNLDCPSYILRVDGFDCPLRLGANSVSSGGALTINWPNSANGYNLESTTNLTSPVWLPVTNQPISSGGNFIITNTLTAPRSFYRLHKP